ncbi:YkgJ family cysteine cluster protein [Salinisphaera sp.]|uniref:YkgJ family cysteine cluster protein n=1 Tax=Salinisphaera sp. TaxID=1914330 RepID=UPI000C47F516|nr:zinc/iron-chelating domain-containing protein [Salinisphaera sp.]
MMHPCLSCGACCAHFRVAFHWLETEQADGTGVPTELTETLDPHRLVMKGTRNGAVRCVALAADIGQHARCTIYDQRPSVCRDVAASWEFGQPSPQCDRARSAHGLAPLTERDWAHVQPAVAANEPGLRPPNAPVAA